MVGIMVRDKHFKAGAIGIAFKNGKLYEFTDRHVLVMKGYPDPRGWFKRRSHGFKPTRKFADNVFSQENFLNDTPAVTKPTTPFSLPDGQLLLQGIKIPEERRAWGEYGAYRARTSFTSTIPEEIKQELQKYSTRRWHLLNLFARCTNSLDLSRSNPALCYALASNWVFHQPAVTKPIRAARSLIGKRQTVIQAWLGFPDTESVRKLLAKICPEAVSVESLLYLRDALKNPLCLKLLKHLPKINRQALMIASDRRTIQHSSPRLLMDVVNILDEMGTDGDPVETIDVYRLMLDTVRMANIVEWEDCPRRFTSLKHLQKIHDQLSPLMNAERLRRFNNIPEKFADPPFTGNANILPLMTPEEICQEGYVQRNCVGSYVLPVSDGSEFVYRVEAPVRATLSVAFKSGSWQPSQLFMARNEPVDPDLKRQIFEDLFKTRFSAVYP